MTKYDINYRFGLCSDKARSFIVGTKETPNPLGSKARILPFGNLGVGESLFFHVDEMIYGKIMRAREAMNRLNSYYDNRFVLVKHDEPIKMVEIVRIK